MNREHAPIEIMAPVGCWESLAAAIQAGATSVYFGIMMGVSREQKTLRDRVQETIVESAEEAPIVTLE